MLDIGCGIGGNNGFELQAIHPGSWRADGAGTTLRDVVIARRR